MAHRRRSADWSAGERVVLFVASGLFLTSLVPAVADSQVLIGVASGLRPMDTRGLSPSLAVFVGSFLTVLWCIVRAERRGSTRRRRRLIVIASQIREAREAAERQRLLDEQEEVERRRERRVSIASIQLMVAVVGIAAAFLFFR